MPTFTYSEEEARRCKRSTFLFAFVPFIFAVVTAFLVPIFLDVRLLVVFEYLFFWMFMLLFAWFYGGSRFRTHADSEASLQITIGQNFIEQSKNGREPITINQLQAVKVIEFQGEGLRINTEEEKRFIFIPSKLSGYDEIRAYVLGWGPIISKPKRTYLGYLVLGGAIGFLVLMPFETTRLYALITGAFLLVALYLWGYIEQFRKSSKRK